MSVINKIVSSFTVFCGKIFTVNRSTFVNKKAREQFELDSYRRLLDIEDSNAKTVDALMKLELPSGVEVEIKV